MKRKYTMIETACPAAFDPELAQNPDRLLAASLSNAPIVEFLPCFLQRAFAHWKNFRAAETSKWKREAVLNSLDARTLYDIGATDIVNSGPRLFWK
jgi:hypothetical protein